MQALDPALFTLAGNQPTTLFDTHAHLGAEALTPDSPQVIARARQMGVERLLTIGAGTGMASNEQAVALAVEHPGIWATVGIHPHEALVWDQTVAATFKELCRQRRNKIVAIGEIGLDFHYNYSPPAIQIAVFTEQLKMAGQLELPFIVHTRAAHEQTMQLLSPHQQHIEKHGGVIHCFSEGPEEAKAYLALGLHLSFAGVVTFPKAQAVREALSIVPQEKLLIETDCPYLAPQPHRGKRNEPGCLYWTAQKIAELRAVPLKALAASTFNNANRLFRLQA